MKNFITLIFGCCLLTSSLKAQILDRGFETYISSPWTVSSTNFGSPICNAQRCGTGGGLCFPRSGNQYVWFGGAPNAIETGSIEQSVYVANGTTGVLEFYLYIPVYGSALPADRLDVYVDNVLIHSITAADYAIYRAGYVLVSIPVDSYTDGTRHLFKLVGLQTTFDHVNFLLDDVSLIIDGNGTTSLFDNVEDQKSITMHPNPTTNSFRLQNFEASPESQYMLTLTDITGKTVKTLQQVSQDDVDVSDLGAGLYFVTLYKDGERIHTDKLSVVK